MLPPGYLALMVWEVNFVRRKQKEERNYLLIVKKIFLGGKNGMWEAEDEEKLPPNSSKRSLGR